MCLKIKSAESLDRKSQYDQVLAGYMDGSILLHQLSKGKKCKSEAIWQDERPIIDIEIDYRGRILFVLDIGEIYLLEDRIASKITSGARGNQWLIV